MNDKEIIITAEYPSTIEGVAVEESRRAGDLNELRDAVAQLAGKRRAIFPAGGRSALDFGLPPTRPGVLIDVTRLDQVEDYPSEDMTITVGTGIRMSRLVEILGEKSQSLPIDCPNPKVATLGGMIATNSSGPRRYGYGTLRDYILGIEVVCADGAVVHGGGRVVKNVAGYDVMKLHTGALGTLGIVTKVTLKVPPKAEARAAMVFGVEVEHLETTLRTLERSDTRPVAVELLNARAASSIDGLSDEHPWTIVLLFEESAPAVEWQVKQVQEELATLQPSTNAAEVDDYDALLSSLSAWRALPHQVLVKTNLLPGDVAEYCQRIDRSIDGAAVIAEAGNGIVWTATDATDVVSEVPSWTPAHGGSTLHRCPLEIKSRFSLWEPHRKEADLMRRIKAKLDPHDVFNPGRLLAD